MEESRIALMAILFVLMVTSGKQVIDRHNYNSDLWIAWSEWSSSNCTIKGNRAVPGFLGWSDDVATYECTDETIWEARRDRAPEGWERPQIKTESKNKDGSIL